MSMYEATGWIKKKAPGLSTCKEKWYGLFICYLQQLVCVWSRNASSVHLSPEEGRGVNESMPLNGPEALEERRGEMERYRKSRGWWYDVD